MFFHLGRANVIENNVLVNATNSDGHGGQLAVTGKAGVTGNNSFSRNVVAFSQTATSCVWYDGGGQANFKPHYLPAARVEANVYFPYSETVASRASPESNDSGYAANRMSKSLRSAGVSGSSASSRAA